MRRIVLFGALTVFGCGIVGCSQITVTSHALAKGTKQIADATTDASRETSHSTTNATDDHYAQNQKARRHFVHSQYTLLKSEAARGSGEDLDTLAYMMQARNKQAFESKVQAHYGRLFSGQPNAEAFLSRLYTVVGKPPDMRAVAANLRSSG